MKIALALVACLLLASCAVTLTPISVPPAPTPSATPRYGEAFTLRGGQEVRFTASPPQRYTIKGNYNVNRVQFDGLAIEFIDLNPYPQQPDEFAKVKPLSTYVVTLRATGARVE